MCYTSEDIDSISNALIFINCNDMDFIMNTLPDLDLLLDITQKLIA
jgi:hypothetical protein